jgi:hypothetical protein
MTDSFQRGFHRYRMLKIAMLANAPKTSVFSRPRADLSQVKKTPRKAGLLF